MVGLEVTEVALEGGAALEDPTVFGILAGEACPAGKVCEGIKGGGSGVAGDEAIVCVERGAVRFE